MARPIHADAEVTRQRVLEAASGLFSELGGARATMRQIAREAGVSMATVHHYFGSKDELYEACVAAMYAELEQLFDELEPLLMQVGRLELPELVQGVVRRAYDFSRRHRPAVQLVMRNLLDTGGLIPGPREQVMVPFLEEGARLLAPLLGWSTADAHMTLLSINYLIARYTLNSTEELALVTGNIEAPEQEVLRAVEDHLVSAACRLLGIPSPRRNHDE